MRGLEAPTDAQAHADDGAVEIGQVDVPVGKDPELEVALGDPVHSDPRGDDEIHRSPVGDVQAGLEAEAGGGRPGGGVERGAEEHTPELRVRHVEPAEVDPVEVRVPERRGQAGEQGWAELAALDGDRTAAVGGDREPAQASGTGDVAALADLRT